MHMKDLMLIVTLTKWDQMIKALPSLIRIEINCGYTFCLCTKRGAWNLCYRKSLCSLPMTGKKLIYYWINTSNLIVILLHSKVRHLKGTMKLHDLELMEVLVKLMRKPSQRCKKTVKSVLHDYNANISTPIKTKEIYSLKTNRIYAPYEFFSQPS